MRQGKRTKTAENEQEDKRRGKGSARRPKWVAWAILALAVGISLPSFPCQPKWSFSPKSFAEQKETGDGVRGGTAVI